jgi:hypothetical protein
MSRPAPIQHTSIAAARAYYRWRRGGFASWAALELAEQQARGRPVAAVIAHGLRTASALGARP